MTRNQGYDMVTATTFSIEFFTRGMWVSEPNGDFETIEAAEAAIQSLADVCGYDADTMRIVEIND